MTESSYEIFQRECPELATKFNELVQVQRSVKGLDQKTKQLINIAIQTAHKNPMAVELHTKMAKTEGAKREEVVNAVTMNLHLSGLSTVLECLPSAIKGYDSI
ncbi:MAG: carboxymuconolactone decarboxylase family protein [Methanobacterium sp.]|nr:carboxymuconolactone decarboxylase family protein [Methanobacterium sp.]